MNKITVMGGLRGLTKKNYKSVHTDCIAAIKEDVNNPIPYFLLGVIAFDHQNYVKALELFTKAETIDTLEPYFTTYKAMTLSTLRRSNDAQLAANKAASIVKEDAHLSDMIGVVYSRCGYHEKAIAHFHAAVKAMPLEPNYVFNLAASQQFLGDFKAAEQAYDKTLDLDKKNYRAWSSLISLRKQTAESNHLKTLKALFAEANLGADAKLHLGHAISKTLEDLGQHEESLDWLLRAKADKREEFPFNRDNASALFKAAKETHKPSNISTEYAQKRTPIFVVGLPRTGTTLVDRILSSHSQVVSVGELNAFAEQIKTLSGTVTPYVLDVETLAATQELNITLAGKAYLDMTESLVSGSPMMLDKMPLNFFYAALLVKAFPEVKIIALRRGPMDSCLSNFRQLFSTQFSYYNYTFDLEDTGYFYNLFDDLMKHWRKHLRAENFIEIYYEDIVSDQKNQTRRLLEFCGLPWEDACMRFHENTAPVSTASSVQVRQPLYSGSIGRWKKYGTKLDDLKAVLGDLVD